MKRITQALVVLAVIVGLAPVRAGSQAGGALPTVDQVLDKAVAAIGGRAALEKVTSRTVKGTIDIPDAGVSGTIELFEKAPNKNAVLVELGGMQIREAFDGQIGWDDNPQTGLREKTGTELADARRGATFNPELHMKTMYPKMTVRGREKVGTMDTIVIDAVPVDGAPAAFFFDVDTGLIVRHDATRESPQGPVQVQVFFDDFRVVDGIKMPFVMRQVTSMFSMVIRIAEIKHNVTLDDQMFKKPGL